MSRSIRVTNETSGDVGRALREAGFPGTQVGGGADWVNPTWWLGPSSEPNMHSGDFYLFETDESEVVGETDEGDPIYEIRFDLLQTDYDEDEGMTDTENEIVVIASDLSLRDAIILAKEHVPKRSSPPLSRISGRRRRHG